MSATQTLEDRLTHLVSLWLWNEEPTYLHVLELGRLSKDEHELAGMLQEEYGSHGLQGMHGDLMTTALAFVNWHSLAVEVLEHLVE